jgi:hypothetical protein
MEAFHILDDCVEFFSLFIGSIEPDNDNLSHFLAEYQPITIELVEINQFRAQIAPHLNSFLIQWFPEIIFKLTDLQCPSSSRDRDHINEFFGDVSPIISWTFTHDILPLFPAFIHLATPTPSSSFSSSSSFASSVRRTFFDSLNNTEVFTIMMNRFIFRVLISLYFHVFLSCFFELVRLVFPGKSYLIQNNSHLTLYRSYRISPPYRTLSGRIFTFSVKTQECDELAMIDKGIRKEKSKLKFESDEVDCETVYFGLNFWGFVEEFDCFQISIIGNIDVILSTESIFPDVCSLWQYFERSLNLIPHFNVNLNSFCTKETMMKDIESNYFVITNDGNKSKSTEQTINLGERMMRSECNFVLKESDVSKIEMFWSKETAKENIVSEEYEIGHLLRLSGGSRKESCSSFSGTKSIDVVEIEDSVEIIQIEDFNCYVSLTKVFFHHRII